MSVSQKGLSISLQGPALQPSARQVFRHNAWEAVRKLTEEGRDLVRAGITPKQPTQFTRSHVEAKMYPEYRGGNLYGRVRMEPKLTRDPDKTGGRRPYIVAAVLESGRSGGHLGLRVSMASSGTTRTKQTWKSGTKRQKPLWAFRNATQRLQGAAKLGDLTRGLE